MKFKDILKFSFLNISRSKKNIYILLVVILCSLISLFSLTILVSFNQFIESNYYKNIGFRTLNVFYADGSDEEILLEEGIENTDAFLALTGLDEENLILSLYAKNLYRRKTVAKVTRMNFTGLTDSLKVDSIVAPKQIIAGQIIRYVRAKMNKDDDSSVKTFLTRWVLIPTSKQK